MCTHRQVAGHSGCVFGWSMGVLYASCRSHHWATASASSAGEGAVEPSADIYATGVELAGRGVRPTPPSRQRVGESAWASETQHEHGTLESGAGEKNIERSAGIDAMGGRRQSGVDIDATRVEAHGREGRQAQHGHRRDGGSARGEPSAGHCRAAWTSDLDPSSDMDATDVESARWGGRDVEPSVGIDGAHFGVPWPHRGHARAWNSVDLRGPHRWMTLRLIGQALGCPDLGGVTQYHAEGTWGGAYLSEVVLVAHGEMVHTHDIAKIRGICGTHEKLGNARFPGHPMHEIIGYHHSTQNHDISSLMLVLESTGTWRAHRIGLAKYADDEQTDWWISGESASQDMTPGKNDSCGVFVQSKDTGGVKTLLKQSDIPSVEQKKGARVCTAFWFADIGPKRKVESNTVSVLYGQPRSPSKYSDDRVLFKGLLRAFWNAHLEQCTGFDTGTIEIFELTGSKQAERNTVLHVACVPMLNFRDSESG
ncbi:hypothetical protein DFH08DRAFT_825752 [Mycena albidolilacea]|uniref:Uncharacterized protein n=1 Tax=Mycena albidolilacea TaxID=1033008 RepID=A0AAD7E9X1_9AGAR|nr:hypothetical protein DFH08DRAFT_825752 [Mycena albidolilacea]